MFHNKQTFVTNKSSNVIYNPINFQISKLLMILRDIRLMMLTESNSITSGVSPKSTINLMSSNTGLASVNSISPENDLLQIEAAINSPLEFLITTLSSVKPSISLIATSEFNLNQLLLGGDHFSSLITRD